MEAHTGLADIFVQRHRSARVDAEFGRRPIPGMRPRSRAEHHVVIAKAKIYGVSPAVSVLAKVQRFATGSNMVSLYGTVRRRGQVAAHISLTLTELAG
jgi:hypothetical protein